MDATVTLAGNEDIKATSVDSCRFNRRKLIIIPYEKININIEALQCVDCECHSLMMPKIILSIENIFTALMKQE